MISITFPNAPPAITIGPFDLLTALSAPDNQNPRYAVMPFAFTTDGTITDPPCAPASLNHQAISFGGEASFFGAVYAPNGYVQMSFSSGGSLDGAVIAQKLSISGSSFTITYNPKWIPSIPPEISVTQ